MFADLGLWLIDTVIAILSTPVLGSLIAWIGQNAIPLIVGGLVLCAMMAFIQDKIGL